MTIYPTITTGGGNIEYSLETALGTTDTTWKDFRICEDANPTFPTDTREVLPLSFRGYRDPSTRDPQVSYEKFRENAITIATYVSTKVPATAGTISDRPQWLNMLRAMGCTLVEANATPTTLDVYSSASSYSLDADKSGVGEVGIIELTNGTFWPQLTGTYTGSATWTIEPTMALPSPGSGITDYDFYQGWSVIPPKGVAATTGTSMSFRVSSFYNTSTETGSCYVYSGVVPSELKDVVFESGKPIKMEFSAHCCDIDWDDSGIDLTTAAYDDRPDIVIVDGAGDFRFGLATYAVPAIAATRTTGFRSAKFTPGIAVTPVMETGSATAVNGCGGFLCHYTGARIELTMDVNKDYWTKLESSAAQDGLYLELVQPTSAMSHGAFGLWLPKCYLTGKPSADLWGDKEMTVTVTLEPTAGPYATAAKTDQGAAPWIMGCSPYIA
jgi:hypothetical protein